jgi:hypothetical protein
MRAIGFDLGSLQTLMPSPRRIVQPGRDPRSHPFMLASHARWQVFCEEHWGEQAI